MKQLKILPQITKRTQSLEKYFQEIDKVQLITAEEEIILTRKIREGDQVAMEKLTTANLRFVVSVAKQYDRGVHNLTLGDLISEGNIGLIKAAGKFDETRGFKFISYAVWWIRQAIISAISENSRTIRQPMNRVNTYNHLLRSFSTLEQEYEREPTNQEIADAMNVPEDYVAQIKQVGSRTASLDAPMQLEEAGNLLDVLKNKEASSPDGDAMIDSLQEDMRNALRSLTNRESEILVLFYGLSNGPGLTLHAIGEKLEITQERVRQVKEVAIRKLQTRLRYSDHLKAYLR